MKNKKTKLTDGGEKANTNTIIGGDTIYMRNPLNNSKDINIVEPKQRYTNKNMKINLQSQPKQPQPQQSQPKQPQPQQPQPIDKYTQLYKEKDYDIYKYRFYNGKVYMNMAGNIPMMLLFTSPKNTTRKPLTRKTPIRKNPIRQHKTV